MRTALRLVITAAAIAALLMAIAACGGDHRSDTRDR
jgi:hypothetical protein